MKAKLLAVVLAGLSGTAFAQDARRLPEFALERFHLDVVSRGGLTAASGDTLPKFKFRPSLAFHYENNPLVYFRNTERVGALVGHRLTLHVGAAFGITSWLTVAAELPLVLFQVGDDLSAVAATTSPDSFALGSPRVAARLGILSQRSGGLVARMPVDLALQLGTALPFGVGAGFAIESGGNVFPQLSVGRDFGPVRVGGEVTGFIRPVPVDLTTVRAIIRDQVGSQLAVRALVSTTGDGARFEGSFHTGVALGGDRTPPGFELLVGGRVPLGPVELFGVAGPGFGSLPGTPTFRALVGVGLRAESPDTCAPNQKHTPQECPDLDDDKDGLVNAVDRCPLEPEDADGWQDDDGCPDPDNDKDGVADEKDKCPLQKGPAVNHGCPMPKAPIQKDTDGDGLLDAQDDCPWEVGPKERKGCPLLDDDGDGIPDETDACPKDPGPVARKGCPLKDRDGDSVEDHVDNCPDEKGPADNQGCPAAKKQLVIITTEKLVIKEKVFFATAKATILAKSFPLLNQVAKVLRDHPEIAKVTVEGHTDNVGKADYNRKLSRLRAESVRNFLVHQGVEAERLDALGFGPDRPADSNNTEEGRANNRRVEFIIDTPQKTKVKKVE